MPQIADRKSMARYICVDKGATHPALQREELPKHMAIYADYGVTGTDLRQRPELNRLLTDCRAGRVNCIVVQSTTHLARRTADLLTILQELQSLGITTDFEKERFSTNAALYALEKGRPRKDLYGAAERICNRKLFAYSNQSVRMNSNRRFCQSIIDCNVIRKRFWNHLWMTCLGYGICKNKNIKNALHLEKIFSILQNRNTILPESIH